jgi:AcrR family transcriptional regulator
MSADDRRELVLDAAQTEFAKRGYESTTTEAIANRVGVSQPYLFRLFPSKKAILVASMTRCFVRLETIFETAAQDLTGEAALVRMGQAYRELLSNRAILQMQLQMWALACGDTEIRDLARDRMGRLWAQVKRLSGADDTRVMQFMAGGMLVNVAAAMDLPVLTEQLGESLAGLTRP